MKKFIEKRRWGLPGGHPGKEYPPLNKELLDYAINHLGDAARGNRASVADRIDFIVGLHRTLKVFEENPPRIKAIRSNLTNVKESAKELRSLIAALDYVSLRELRQHGAFRHPSLIVPIDAEASVQDEQRLAALVQIVRSRLLSMLDAIVEALVAVR